MGINSTIRELFLAIGFAALAIAGIVTGPAMSWIALGVFVCLLLARLIDSLVQSGVRRHTSVAFTVVASLYLLLCAYIGESEFHPYNSSPSNLPTTQLIRNYMYPIYTPGESSRGEYLARAQIAKTSLPLGHLAIACVMGYAGVWYVRLTRNEQAHHTG